jgi:hypothetical protein
MHSSSLTTKSAVVRVRSTLQRDLHSGPVLVVQFGLQIRLFRNQVTSDSDYDLRLGEGRACIYGTSAADFMCKECVTASARAIRLIHIESPMRLARNSQSVRRIYNGKLFAF